MCVTLFLLCKKKKGCKKMMDLMRKNKKVINVEPNEL